MEIAANLKQPPHPDERLVAACRLVIAGTHVTLTLALLYWPTRSWNDLLPHDGLMMFEGDPVKAQFNLRKHRVSFAEAATALLDPSSKTALIRTILLPNAAF